ncbi:MAG TPA: head decoration protein [Ochrobactrum intermedium]|uniref:Head decoration protein n=1 Tax=Brucella intermedia TaxID=94625 RepID=A0A7V6PFA3_9HYPH|nr:head decoration protein [Brucella intermedia]HHV69918.1 head decoration protein [Brucella intermedia]
MSTILHEDRRRTAHYIISEANGYRSRDVGLVASGSGKLIAGTVMARQSTTGKFVPYDPAGEDGSEAAAAVLYEGCDATSGDVRRTFTARDTEVQAEALIWPDTATDEQKNTALATLAGVGIVAR